MFDHTKFRRVFEASGLRKAELAKLYGVSRQTIYDWYTGASAPAQKALVEREVLYTKGLLAAVDRGVLPLKEKDVKIRSHRILAMARSLHALTAPK